MRRFAGTLLMLLTLVVALPERAFATDPACGESCCCCGDSGSDDSCPCSIDQPDTPDEPLLFSPGTECPACPGSPEARTTFRHVVAPPQVFIPRPFVGPRAPPAAYRSVLMAWLH
ncbi:hypothetical protein HAHE_16780 [Haloferula helveola]|uniref:Secreted protein n=1 Tax=Haloferula helveola TaxID=490095 RepID=A0ABM7R995_9BACT|nr:hypothetical protein HAHE_16780 [Haloferula helveola]